jgi:hypothetical protein
MWISGERDAQDQAEKPAWSRAWDFLVEVASANATLVDRTRHDATVGVYV